MTDIETPATGSASAEPRQEWYALKVYHSRVFAYEEAVKARGVETYLPTEMVAMERDGKLVMKRKPVIPSLIFVRTDAETLATLRLVDGMTAMVYKRPDPTGRMLPAPIPQREMEMFILVSSSGERGLDYYEAEALNLSEGNRVRVTAGIFKGSEGYIKRIKGNRRFVVCINGLCAVATPYIPVAFLERLDKEAPSSQGKP